MIFAKPTPLFITVGVDFRDKTAGELHHCRSATSNTVGLSYNPRSGSLCLHNRIGKIVDVVPGYFAPIGIWEMTIGSQHSDFSESESIRTRRYTSLGLPISTPDAL